MRKILQLIVLMVTFCFAGASFGADQGSAEEAVAMVQKVIAHMKANGKEKTIAEINSMSDKFKDRDLYAVIYDMNGVAVAHANKKMQGKNMFDLKDVDGKYFIRERLEMAKTKGKGWQDYKFANPVTSKVEPKSMYIEKYEDLIIACGIYKG
jgi:cytochrome c